MQAKENLFGMNHPSMSFGEESQENTTRGIIIAYMLFSLLIELPPCRKDLQFLIF